jgi:hypothetical protein
VAEVGLKRDEVGSIFVDDALCFVNREGKTLPAFPFDNGADDFVEGLARNLEGGKVGFVNTRFDQVVAPIWDWADYFQNGIAAVCRGCVSARLPNCDEHCGTLIGGKWGYIDGTGRVVVPVIYDLIDLPSAESAAAKAGR